MWWSTFFFICPWAKRDNCWGPDPATRLLESSSSLFVKTTWCHFLRLATLLVCPGSHCCSSGWSRQAYCRGKNSLSGFPTLCKLSWSVREIIAWSMLWWSNTRVCYVKTHTLSWRLLRVWTWPPIASWLGVPETWLLGGHGWSFLKPARSNQLAYWPSGPWIFHRW
jgi:hypothetical protein